MVYQRRQNPTQVHSFAGHLLLLISTPSFPFSKCTFRVPMVTLTQLFPLFQLFQLFHHSLCICLVLDLLLYLQFFLFVCNSRVVQIWRVLARFPSSFYLRFNHPLTHSLLLHTPFCHCNQTYFILAGNFTIFLFPQISLLLCSSAFCVFLFVPHKLFIITRHVVSTRSIRRRKAQSTQAECRHPTRLIPKSTTSNA